MDFSRRSEASLRTCWFRKSFTTPRSGTVPDVPAMLRALSTMKTALKVAAGIVAACLVLVLAAYGWLKWSPRRVPDGQPPLATLDAQSLPEFRAAFNASKGDVRILAMLSPT